MHRGGDVEFIKKSSSSAMLGSARHQRIKVDVDTKITGGLPPFCTLHFSLECSAREDCLLQRQQQKMTRFRDTEVCNNLATDEIDNQRIQSDYKCISGLQTPEGERTPHLVLRLRGETEHDTNDNVTTKTQSTFHAAHMNLNT